MMLKDSRNDLYYKEFNIGDHVIVCGHLGRFHELCHGKIVHKQPDWFNNYEYIIDNCLNGMMIDPINLTIMDYDETIFNKFRKLDNELWDLENKQKEINKELNNIIPHRH